MGSKREVLTDREVEVLLMVIRAGSTDQAAYRLGISPQTVKNHLDHIRDIVGAKTTTQAAWLLFPSLRDQIVIEHTDGRVTIPDH